MTALQSAITREIVATAEEYIQVVTTVNNQKKANQIARSLLDTRAAACVQIIGPVVSSCWWKGQVLQTNEWICVAKARVEDYDRLEDVIKSLHPYEVPEILATPIQFGYPAYLNWIRDETTPR